MLKNEVKLEHQIWLDDLDGRYKQDMNSFYFKMEPGKKIANMMEEVVVAMHEVLEEEK